MKIPQSSKIELYSDVDVSTGVQIAFPNRSIQSAYFASKQVYSASVSARKFSYIRKSGTVKLQISAEQAKTVDYMSFINPSFENIKYYCKVINWEYVNNVTTVLTYAIDYFQTFMFDVKYEYGLIEREHLSKYDFVRAQINPWRNDIYELQTVEDLPSSKDMERLYSADDMEYMPELIDGGSTKVAFLFVANFDTSIVDPSPLYAFCDFFYSSSGELKAGSGPNLSYPIARGYGFGIITLSGGGGQKLAGAINWLTYQGLKDNIIGIVQTTFSNAAYFQLASLPISERVLNTMSILPGGLNDMGIRNPKLARFPFHYMRVCNFEGEIKEYKYESFSSIVSGSLGTGDRPEAKFAYFPIFESVPMTSLIPLGYMNNKENVPNPEERIDSKTFPQIGYNTDAYLTFLANQYSSNLQQRTYTSGEAVNIQIDRAVDNLNRNGEFGKATALETARSAGPGSAAGIVSAGKSLASGNVAGAASGVANAAGSVLDSYTTYSSPRTEATAWRNGGNYMNNSVFGAAKPAFANDEYHPGLTNGILGEYLPTPIPAGTFLLTKVALNEEILSAYDGYLDSYGYASNRVGLPRICNYISGDTNEKDIPYFASFNGINVTYVKTSNMHVEHNIREVADSIEEMFNTGIQFIDGGQL